MTFEWVTDNGGRLLGKRLYAARDSDRQHPRYAPPMNVACLQFPFRKWTGKQLPWHKHLGKAGKQVRSLDWRKPRRSCNEVEVAKILREVRDHAYWVSPFRTKPCLWENWMLFDTELPEWLARLDAAIHRRTRFQSGGVPDVVAWGDDDPMRSALFIECKGEGEPFSESQEDWLWAGLREGLKIDQFAVSVRPF